MRTLSIVNTDAALMAAIRNMMDDDFAEQVARDGAETEEEFVIQYLKLDPEFEIVLSTEFSVDI